MENQGAHNKHMGTTQEVACVSAQSCTSAAGLFHQIDPSVKKAFRNTARLDSNLASYSGCRGSAVGARNNHYAHVLPALA